MQEKSPLNFNLHEKSGQSEKILFLREKASQAPNKPGVYLHKANDGKILYVGKAKNLQARLRSYFTGLERHTPKTKALVAKINDFDIIITESEYESLILENNLIKHNKPNYNILLRDDKTYPYIKIDIHEQWPRVTITRKRKKDNSLYFGPYTIAGQVSQLMNIINRFFPLVKCSPTFFKTVTRPCNYYDIKKCLGPCKINVDKNEYFLYINNVIDILNSKYNLILKKLKDEMEQEAIKFNFEKAALLRDQIKVLETLKSNQSVTLEIDLDIDIIGFYWNKTIISLYITNVREGKVIGGNAKIIKNNSEEPEDENCNLKESEQERVFSSILCQYYQNNHIPNNILFDMEKNFFCEENYNIINKYLKNLKKSQESTENILFLRKENYFKKNNITNKSVIKKIKELIILTNKNAENKFFEQVKIDENSNNEMLSLQNFLNLDELPQWIECYDISTFQGAETVASQVVFKNAKPEKREYRKYIIKETLGKTDDFASLREVIRRRFKDIEIYSVPNLIVIDGGTPQIREVSWVFKSLGLENVNIIGIAKSRTKNDFQSAKILQSFERVVIPVRDSFGKLTPEKEPITKNLPLGSPEFKLLTQLRNEAHRFAITFHRNRRNKTGLKSILLDIKGLGSKRRKRLLELYPNLIELTEQSLTDIAKNTGISENLLSNVIEKIKKFQDKKS